MGEQAILSGSLGKVGDQLSCANNTGTSSGGYSPTEVVGEELGEFSGAQATRARSPMASISNIEHRHQHRSRLQ